MLARMLPAEFVIGSLMFAIQIAVQPPVLARGHPTVVRACVFLIELIMNVVMLVVQIIVEIAMRISRFVTAIARVAVATAADNDGKPSLR